MYRLAVLLLCITLVGEAQKPRAKGRPSAPKPTTAVDAPSQWPVEQIDVEGLRNYNRQGVLDVLQLRTGQPVDKVALDAARDRLAATGAFASIAYRYGPSASGRGYKVTFELVEVDQIYPYRSERLPITDEELHAWLRQRNPMFGDKIPATRELVDRYCRQIEELLAQKGSPAAVHGKLTQDQPEELFILFYPEGAPPVVARVTFRNNQVLPADLLQRTIRGVAVGTEYREPFFRRLLDTSIRPLYEARGRLRVSFPVVTTEAAGDVKGLAVTVTVNEGDSYSLGKLEVRGVEGLNEQLVRAANLKPGDLANFEQVAEGVERIRKLMQNNGYMRVKTSLERRIDDEKKVVDLLLDVEPGPQFRFGKLRIRGLDLHGEAEVRKMWSLAPGKPFNAGYPDFFLAQVRERGIFEDLGKTRSVADIDDSNLVVDVTLEFSREKAPATLRPGAANPM